MHKPKPKRVIYRGIPATLIDFKEVIDTKVLEKEDYYDIVEARLPEYIEGLNRDSKPIIPFDEINLEEITSISYSKFIRDNEDKEIFHEHYGILYTLNLSFIHESGRSIQQYNSQAVLIQRLKFVSSNSSWYTNKDILIPTFELTQGSNAHIVNNEKLSYEAVLHSLLTDTAVNYELLEIHHKRLANYSFEKKQSPIRSIEENDWRYIIRNSKCSSTNSGNIVLYLFNKTADEISKIAEQYRLLIHSIFENKSLFYAAAVHITAARVFHERISSVKPEDRAQSIIKEAYKHSYAKANEIVNQLSLELPKEASQLKELI